MHQRRAVEYCNFLPALFTKKLPGRMKEEQRRNAAEERCAEMLVDEDIRGQVVLDKFTNKVQNKEILGLVSEDESEDENAESTQRQKRKSDAPRPRKKNKQDPKATKPNDKLFRFTEIQNRNFKKVFEPIIERCKREGREAHVGEVVELAAGCEVGQSPLLLHHTYWDWSG